MCGRVRGLLCVTCNGALGRFRARPDLMLRDVVYLRRDEPGRFEVPADAVGFFVGLGENSRPAGEPRLPFPPDRYDAASVGSDTEPTVSEERR